MLCLKCKSEQFAERVVATPQTFRGEEFAVQAKAMVCSECGWQTVTDAQADALWVLTADEYRRRHGLLTSEDIKGCRKACQKSQRQFARFLGVGEASVKRWEKGTVQEPIYDQRIREKCGARTAEQGWGLLRLASPWAIQITNFQVTTTTVILTRRQNLRKIAGFSAKAAHYDLTVRLSDGHAWRETHFAANDSTLSPSA